MRIALLITRLPAEQIGGAELQVRQLADRLVQRGHEVTVFTRGRAASAGDGNTFNVKYRRVIEIPGLRLFADVLRAAWQIARHTPSPEVLLCYQTFSSGLIGVVVQTLLGIPAVVSIRGGKEYRLQHSVLNRLLSDRVHRRARLITVQSPTVEEDLRGCMEATGRSELLQVMLRKLEVVPNGISLEGRTRARGDNVLFVGRLVRWKGVNDLLAALRPDDDFRLVIVGDGPERKKLEALARGLPVTFVGEVRPDEVEAHLQQARMLVLPSYVEGFPNVILEAMACGLPVVASRTGGIPDMITHEENGLLFEPGDVEELRSCIQVLRTDETGWQSMAEQALAIAENYSWERVVPQLEAVLASALRTPVAASAESSASPATPRRSPDSPEKSPVDSTSR